ncbi:MAG: hypothetical protein PHT16_00975 [Candidatus Pacebacteria bacterium]|nr:hypothetical protein [Candidatus Paceibacterota bacterium]
MKNNFQKILILISIILLFLLSFAFVFTYQKINDNNQKTEQDTINLKTETLRRDNIASLDQSLQKIAPDRISLENHFIKSSDIVPFLNMIERLGEESGVSTEINSISTKTDNTELTVELRAAGRFEGIYKFLTLLENSPYELDFTSMNIHKAGSSSATDKNAKGPNWEAVFKIKLLSFIP